MEIGAMPSVPRTIAVVAQLLDRVHTREHARRRYITNGRFVGGETVGERGGRGISASNRFRARVLISNVKARQAITREPLPRD